MQLDGFIDYVTGTTPTLTTSIQTAAFVAESITYPRPVIVDASWICYDGVETNGLEVGVNVDTILSVGSRDSGAALGPSPHPTTQRPSMMPNVRMWNLPFTSGYAAKKFLRKWVGERLISLGVRIAGEEMLEDVHEEYDEQDDEGEILPVVQMNARAQQMLADGHPMPRATVKEPRKVLIGSLADRAARQSSLRRR